MFSDMDRNLREMGVGDLSVGKQVKKMAAAFYGRAELWEDSLNLGETALSKTLLETIFRSTNICKGEESMLARYLIKLDCALGEMPINHITSNKFSFPAVDYLKQQN
jgi:cytochrome b pre-mRNA-processing protein 3